MSTSTAETSLDQLAEAFELSQQVWEIINNSEAFHAHYLGDFEKLAQLKKAVEDAGDEFKHAMDRMFDLQKRYFLEKDHLRSLGRQWLADLQEQEEQEEQE